VRVVGAAPPLKMADHGTGQVKWLLSAPAPGRHLLVLKLDRAVTAGQANGEIRYREPATGKMVTRAIGG
jgi:hypothetical protein